jgi:hypothetical protein
VCTRVRTRFQLSTAHTTIGRVDMCVCVHGVMGNRVSECKPISSPNILTPRLSLVTDTFYVPYNIKCTVLDLKKDAIQPDHLN